MGRPPLMLALLSAAVALSAESARAQDRFPSAAFRNGFFGPFDGYGGAWGYPSDLSNGPSPYFSPIFNTTAASRPSPTLVPSPYGRSPLDLLRVNRPEFPRWRHRFGRR